MIVLLVVGCKKDQTSIQTKLIGHAGNGMTQWNGMFEANSIEGIKYALSLDNCYGVEVDVSISADSTLWLFHDSKLDGLTNGKGCLSEATDDYLSGLKYTSVHQERLVQLKDILQLNIKKDLILDVKQDSKCQNSSLAYAMIQKSFEELGPLPANVYVNINTLALYSYLKNLGSPIILKIDHIDQATPAFDKEKVMGFMSAASKISKEEVRFLQDKNYKVYLYEVRSTSRLKKELKKKPDFILVDDVLNSVIEL